MDCPACREPMIVAERDRIELDCCPACHGLWADAGEIELLAERLGVPAGTFDPRRFPLSGIAEKLRLCPRCDRPMGKVCCDPAQEVAIDRCPQGHGLWFDRGELGQVLSFFLRLAGRAPEPGQTFLGERFDH